MLPARGACGARSRVWLLGVLLLLASTASNASPVTQIAGLEAWYTTFSLHKRMRGGEQVKIWKDVSGNEHHLTDDENGVPAVFEKLQVGGKPAVVLGESNSHSVAKPFLLRDHTIFLLYQASCRRCALLQGVSEGEDGTGIVLREQGMYDYYKTGTTRVAANRGTSLGGEFGITVLARRDGELRSFVNGVDVSSGSVFDKPIEVGRFFALSHSRASRGDGKGLRVAEMIFYDRYLREAERKAVVDYLAEMYAMDLAPADREPRLETARLWLGTSSSASLNGRGPVAIKWDRPQKVEAPFRHEPEGDVSLFHCTRDGTRARVFVSLPMTTSVADADVRVLVLKNVEDYQTIEGSSGPLAAGSGAVTVRFSVPLLLDAGDYVRILTVAQGAEGKVTLNPDGAFVSVELE